VAGKDNDASEDARIVVVLGTGRSGTSLAMAMLEASGLRLSRDLVGPSIDNPDGHFEDVSINALHQHLTRSIPLFPLLPRPDDWMAAEAFDEVATGLREHVANEIAAGPGLWGFKDPRTGSFWPMWEGILSDLDITPSVVLCSRPSAQIVRSMQVAYNTPQDWAEGIVLYRTLHTLEDVQRPIFFVSNDDWRNDAVQCLQDLTSFCGLDEGLDAEAIVDRCYKPELARQSRVEPLPVSGALTKFDRVLADCHGTDYDRAELDRVCAEVRQEIRDLGFVFEGVERFRRRRAVSRHRGRMDLVRRLRRGLHRRASGSPR
jgi:hypothetical protein